MNPSGDIAIIGMACLFPKAPDVATFWDNILGKVSAVTDAPPEGVAGLYDPEASTNDRIYTNRGGFLGELARFNPFDYGVLPRSIDGGDAEHFIALRVAHEALADAGYLDRPFDRERAAVIIGRGNYFNRGLGTVLQHLAIDPTIRLLATLHPEHTASELDTVKRQLKASLPPFDADTAPGLVSSVMCGRIANRLNLMGSAYAVDAACASSLIAVDLAIQELASGKADMVLAGGIQVSSTVPAMLIFCQLGALSRRGEVRSFSGEADGTLLGEGAGVLVLKRRVDAERDGDRIYALLKAVGVASDGRAVGVLAPRVEGEELAMRRAYEQAGIAPRTVSLVEGHGTGTAVGDAAELEALGRVFGPDNRDDRERPWCALGSVKSMIGHPIPAAGVAGLIKAALALHHKVLPPTLHAGAGNPKLGSTPFYLNTETRPWIHAGAEPRRAAVSAFGFGGINAHAVLEEHPSRESHPHLHRSFDAEVVILSASDRPALIEHGEQLRRVLAANPDLAVVDLAYTLNCPSSAIPTTRLAIVATSIADLETKLARALGRLADPTCDRIEEPSGVYYTDAPLYAAGALAFLFPGLGTQYVNMLADLCVHFPEVRSWFDGMDRVSREGEHGRLPSQVVFPPPGGSTGDPAMLRATDTGGTAVFVANQALYSLLSRLDLRPHAMLGHSLGDFSALGAAGALAVDDEAELIRQSLLLQGVHEPLHREGRIPTGVLLAVGTLEREQVLALVQRSGGALAVAMDNCSHQIVLGGSTEATAEAAEQLRQAGAVCTTLPVDCAYHTPAFAEYSDHFHGFYEQLEFRPPRIPVYSCVTAGQYPNEPEALRKLTADQWSQPVRFRQTVEALYADGARIFVEVGPGGHLTAFTDDILRGRPHLAVPADLAHRTGVTQLAHLVGLLAAHHVPMNLEYLYARRSPRRLPLESGPELARPKAGDAWVRLAVDLPLFELDQLLPPMTSPAVAQAPEPAAAASVPALGAGGGEQVMQAYLDTMDRFLDVQQHTMRALLSRESTTLPDGTRNGDGAPEMVMTGPLPRFPLLGSVVSLTEGRELVAVRRLDLDEDLFLYDHTFFGRQISVTDESLLSLPVVPMTFSMEMLAEAAAALLPGRVVIGMKDIRAYQWIALDDGHATLRLVARLDPAGDGCHVHVELQRLADSAASGAEAGTRVAEGTVVLADAYPASPAATELELRAERPYAQGTTNLYPERMFHGPRFQGVASLDRWGEDGTEATLEILPTHDLFASTPDPALATDPLLLDATGQILGFWAIEELGDEFNAFPFALTELQLFGPTPPAGTRVTGRARIRLLGDRQIRADTDIVGPDGRLLTRLTGWTTYRFDLSKQLTPRGAALGAPWAALTDALVEPKGLACCRIDDPTLATTYSQFWLRVLAHLVLSRRERAAWASLAGSERRRSQWLLERAAAKDAVCAVLCTSFALELYPADIEIVLDEHGRPLVTGPWTLRVDRAPVVSLSHCDGAAVAIAGDGERYEGIGIDLERLDRIDDPLERLASDPHERDLVAALGGPLQQEWALRLSCAKKAAGKVLGREPEHSASLVVAELDRESGRVGMLDGHSPAAPLTVHTVRDGEWIAALAIAER
ncbi:MAG: beta-ketoacyl synthase N-terminal-like domain-containing protein [Egibacteraceae bacterium]